MECEDNKSILLNKLKVISEIKKGDKIIIQDDSIIIDDRYFQSLRRWYNNDNRYLSIIFIENTINEALDTEEKLEETSKSISKRKEHQEELKNAKNDLKTMSESINNAMNGIINIKETYKEDEIITKKLNRLIVRIDESYKE